jgi:hypothetical protein
VLGDSILFAFYMFRTPLHTNHIKPPFITLGGCVEVSA